MLTLRPTDTDDEEFLDLAGRLVGQAALQNGFQRLIVTHVDHWFGTRWLGFCGKLMGIAGVRNRWLTRDLAPPPFHPHRIHSVREFELTAAGYEYRKDVDWLHGARRSESNIGRSLFSGIAYAWYSGDTRTVDRGAVMVYLVLMRRSAAWYAGFRKSPSWRLAQTRAISPGRIGSLLDPASIIDRCVRPDIR
jgi:hypothetical protein